jgi:hypothetical protein
VYTLASYSELRPSTLPLFASILDFYLSSFSKQALQEFGDRIVPVAMNAYRVTAKFNENQEDLWKDSVTSSSAPNRQVCSHQLIYDNLLGQLLAQGIVARPKPDSEDDF